MSSTPATRYIHVRIASSRRSARRTLPDMRHVLMDFFRPLTFWRSSEGVQSLCGECMLHFPSFKQGLSLEIRCQRALRSQEVGHDSRPYPF
jgi:hypothetical protein